LGLHVWHGAAKKGAIIFALARDGIAKKGTCSSTTTKRLEGNVALRIKEKHPVLYYRKLLARNSYVSFL